MVLEFASIVFTVLCLISVIFRPHRSTSYVDAAYLLQTE